MIPAAARAAAGSGASISTSSASFATRGPLVIAPAATRLAPSAAAAAAATPTPRRHSHHRLPPPSAKKGGSGGGGGKGQKKGGGALADLMRKKEADAEAAAQAESDAQARAEAGAASADGNSEPATPAQYADPELLMDLLSVCQSYWKHTGTPLLEGVELDGLAQALYEAPFVCLAHNRFEVEAAAAEDPSAPPQETVFTYANRAALTLFEGGWDQVVGMPSRLSADDSPEAQADRNRLLQEAAKGGDAKGEGIVRNYSGWRRSLKGARFLIKDATLFNVSDLAGDLWGQAVVFDEYETADGRKVKVAGGGATAAAVEASPAALERAEALVAEQAAAVRALKDSGKGNADPEVAAAVEELKQRKEAAAAIAARLGPSAMAAGGGGGGGAGGGETAAAASAGEGQ
jgi:hypothetical protein